MQFKDDRTDQEKVTHHVLIGGTDRVLSGWGQAEGGQSFAFWACRPEHAAQVWRWVKSRGDIMRVRQVSPRYRPSGGKGHCHVYVVHDGHPALDA